MVSLTITGSRLRYLYFCLSEKQKIIVYYKLILLTLISYLARQTDTYSTLVQLQLGRDTQLFH